jgi:hypothetical protein
MQFMSRAGRVTCMQRGCKAALELHGVSRRRSRFGRLTMNDVDMQSIDADPTDPFEFFAGHHPTISWWRATPRRHLPEACGSICRITMRLQDR